MPKLAENIASNSIHKSWSLAILSFCVIIFSITVYYVTSSTATSKTTPLTVSLKSEANDLVVGKSTIVNVYFSGANAAKVLSADIKLKFDPKLVKVAHVEAGPYYNQPIIIKWNQTDYKYSLASNPGVSQTLNPMLSVVKFEITPLKATDKLEIGIDSSTLAYIEKRGEATIKTSPVLFTVKQK